MVSTSERFQLITPSAPLVEGGGFPAPALARCEACNPRDTEKSAYVHSHEVEAVQAKMIVCGARGCARPAKIVWLTEPEHHRYLLGERSFRLARTSARVSLK